MRIAIIFILLLAAPPAAHARQSDLAWLSGHWRSAYGDPVSEEFWTDGSGGLMLGGNRTIADGRAVAFEYLRVETASGGARYCAQPGGGAATCFDLVETGEGHARFENPEHDFPQRIEYRREGDTLTATISDMERTQSLDFVWQRVDR